MAKKIFKELKPLQKLKSPKSTDQDNRKRKRMSKNFKDLEECMPTVVLLTSVSFARRISSKK
jgi:hypothetical protein